MKRAQAAPVIKPETPALRASGQERDMPRRMAPEVGVSTPPTSLTNVDLPGSRTTTSSSTSDFSG